MRAQKKWCAHGGVRDSNPGPFDPNKGLYPLTNTPHFLPSVDENASFSRTSLPRSYVLHPTNTAPTVASMTRRLHACPRPTAFFAFAYPSLLLSHLQAFLRTFFSIGEPPSGFFHPSSFSKAPPLSTFNRKDSMMRKHFNPASLPFYFYYSFLFVVLV